METDQVEFKSLTPEDIEKMRSETDSEGREAIQAKLKSGKSVMGKIGSYVWKGIDIVGETIAILTFFFLVAVFIRSNFRRMVLTAVTALLLVSSLVGAQEHLVEYSLSRDAANLDIKYHQDYMMQNWCQKWRVYDEWEQHTSMSGYYSETLACILAQSNYSCDCKPTPEYIPVVSHSKADRLSKFKNMDCVMALSNNNTQIDKINLLDTYSEHLYYTAKQDRWLTTKHHKLISWMLVSQEAV